MDFCENRDVTSRHHCAGAPSVDSTCRFSAGQLIPGAFGALGKTVKNEDLILLVSLIGLLKTIQQTGVFGGKLSDCRPIEFFTALGE
jgi:hypothetical protein